MAQMGRPQTSRRLTRMTKIASSFLHGLKSTKVIESAEAAVELVHADDDDNGEEEERTT